MSETKTKMPYVEALAIAQDIVRILEPACERIEIAGSIRRKKTEVGDIEVVAIPTRIPIYDLFGEEIGEGLKLNDAIPSEWLCTKNGDKYKQFVLPCAASSPQGCNLDLFLVTPETWGVVFTLRTGNWEFSKRLVTKKQKGGYMPDYMACKDARLWSHGEALDTPEEADVFKAIGRPWTEPEDRT